jgi:hypothetical protein
MPGTTTAYFLILLKTTVGGEMKRSTIPADEAFIPLEKSVCPMAKKS